MKKFLCSLLAILSVAPLSAELNQDDYSSQSALTQKPEEEYKGGPFSVSATANIAGKADFKHKKCGPRLSDVEFADANLSASMIFYYNEPCKEGLLTTLGYTQTKIKWCNPYFNQDEFHAFNLGLAGFTHRYCNWFWEGLFQINFDLDRFHSSDYHSYNIALLGRYDYNECVGLSVGFIILTGLDINRFYPILGFDWRINECWQLNLIFPTNISLAYYLTPEWSVEIAGRAFDERYRISSHRQACFDSCDLQPELASNHCTHKSKHKHKNENHDFKHGVIEYRSLGAEAAIDYKSCDERTHANLHIGMLFGGRVEAANKHHRHIQSHHFRSAPYVGGDFSYRF